MRAVSRSLNAFPISLSVLHPSGTTCLPWLHFDRKGLAQRPRSETVANPETTIWLEYVITCMSRMTKSAKRLPILLVLLEHDAHPLNANRIRLLLKKMNMKVVGDDIRDASISSGAVGKMCEGLERVGLLESELAKPPRRKQKTPHYFLPINDDIKMLRVARFLLDKCGKLFVETRYAGIVIDKMVVPAAENALGMKLNSRLCCYRVIYV